MDKDLLKKSTSFMKSIDVVVNESIKDKQVFNRLRLYYNRLDKPQVPNFNYALDYCLDKYNEGFRKHESLFGTYILISSGLEISEKFFYEDMINPYIDGEFLEDYTGE